MLKGLYCLLPKDSKDCLKFKEKPTFIKHNSIFGKYSVIYAKQFFIFYSIFSMLFPPGVPAFCNRLKLQRHIALPAS